MEGHESADPYRVYKKRRVACSQCRQSKLRCGVEEDPCPRCKRLGLSCTKDPSFRRVNRQAKMEELELQVNQLRGIVGKQPGFGTSPPTDSSHTDSTADQIPPPSVSVSLTTSQSGQHSQPQDSLQSYKSLGSVSLDVSHISALFLVFFEQYHHFLPFLNASRTPEQYYQSSRLLFWAIISVAARQYRVDTGLLSRLSSPLTHLIGATIATNPMDLSTSQAILLVSVWPLPTTRMWTDSSLIFANTALITLQHSGRREECSNVILQDTFERTTTCVACVITSHCLSLDFGHAPNVHFDWAVNQACRPDTGFELPTELRHNLAIQRCSYKAIIALAGNDEDPLGLLPETDRCTIMTNLERDFDALAAQIVADISFINNLRLQAAKMYLQTSYFLEATLKESQEAQAGILRAYSNASSLISSLLSEARSHELLSHAPLSIFRLIFCAAVIVWKTLNSSYGANLDREAGKVLFNAAGFAIRQISVQFDERDLPLRAAEGLSVLWRCGDSDPSLRLKPPALQIKSRMGSSLIYDSIMCLRDFKQKLGMPLGPANKAFKEAHQYLAKKPEPFSNFPSALNGAGSTPVSLLTQNVGLQNWEIMPDMNWIWEYEV